MGKKIFIAMIEDDQDLCDGWADLFELLGYDFKIFQRGQLFLDDLETIRKSHLVITDYYLPDINGVELVKRLRAIRPEVSVLMLTGSRESFIADSLSQLPNTALMHKPLNVDKIEAHINNLPAA